ncbi:MAG: cyanase [Deltaproteobacteria bacterium]|jgi:cyanate lyase|nr:cyanase [Deltaproteobacteria bacterium]
MTRCEAVAAIIAAKKTKNLKWKDIAEAVGASPEWVTSALLGRNSMPGDLAARAVSLLGLDKEVEKILQECPTKGALEAETAADPLIYRFHEITQVYGTTIKELIHEQFGDGIMSAIDFEMEIRRLPDPKGDRVVVTYNGKFLPYRKW